MNVQSAKNALEFCTIVRRDPGSTIVRVPGHGGRVYFVRVTRHTVTCKQSKLQGGGNCPSVSSGVPCYHCLTAWEKVHGPTSWCENEADAKKLENLGKHAVEIRSTQNGAKAWAVVESKPEQDEQARQGQDDLVELGRTYLALFDKSSYAPNEYDELQKCRRQLGLLRLSHSEISNLVAEAELEKNRAVLRGDRDWEEAI